MSLFEWLERTALADWVAASLWGYPLMLSLHVMGLAVVVGVSWMQSFRLLGLLGDVQFRALASLSRLARVGLLVNVLSGLALFSSQATIFIESVPFLTKISAIAVGVVVGLPLQNTLKRNALAWDESAAPGAGIRVAAILSFLCWAAAIVAGRLIAYL